MVNKAKKHRNSLFLNKKRRIKRIFIKLKHYKVLYSKLRKLNNKKILLFELNYLSTQKILV